MASGDKSAAARHARAIRRKLMSLLFFGLSPFLQLPFPRKIACPFLEHSYPFIVSSYATPATPSYTPSTTYSPCIHHAPYPILSNRATPRLRVQRLLRATPPTLSPASAM